MTRPAFGLNRWDWSSPRAFADDVQRAEQLGWDYAFTGVNPLAIWDSYIMLALAATVTTRIRLGTLLENPVLDDPSSTANSIATVDEISGGRAILGYGIGDTAVRFQNRRPATVREMEDATTYARRLLHGESIELGARRPATFHHPRPVPVWIAAGGPRTLRMAGRVADGVFLRVGLHPANLEHAITQVHEGAREAQRDPAEVGIGLIFHTIVPDNTDSVGAIARSMAAGYYEYSPALFEIPGLPWNGPPVEDLQRHVVPDFHHTLDLEGAGRLVDFLDDDAARSFALFGSATEMAAKIDETLNLGFRIDIVVPHPVPTPVPGTPVPRNLPQDLAHLDYTAWFAQEVMPEVHGTTDPSRV